jgi:proteic killer suppression protein
MRLLFRTEALRQLEETDSPEFSESVTERYRSRINLIRSAPDERDFYALKSLHYEKLSGDRARQRSMRLNQQWRLILEIEGDGADKLVAIVAIEDYH